MSAPGTLRILLAGEPGHALDAFAIALSQALRERGREAAISCPTQDQLTASAADAQPQAICLLLGLESTTDDEAAEQAHARWRSTLQVVSQSFRVIYGSRDERLANALRAIDSALAERPARATNWVWSCDKCSDPVCEHQLFRRLVDPAQASPPAAQP